MFDIDRDNHAARTLAAVPLLLAAAAGSLDGAVFSAFHDVVAGAMTGNLVALGLGAGTGTPAALVPAACALGGYAAGLVAGTRTAGLAGRVLGPRGAVALTLALELAVLTVACVAWVLGGPGHAFPVGPVLAVTAGAMGVQGAALRRVGPAGTPTNYFTGTVTNWVSGIAEPGARRWDPATGARIAVFVGAVAAGVALHGVVPTGVIGLPLLLLAAATGLAAHAARRRGTHPHLPGGPATPPVTGRCAARTGVGSALR
ncbi:YoaK family protein [Pseudonocardia spirodelae]|uniref:YoaK family protein n=1 Tax=Pseudonocardia spirodelae TaxID=3133431 RepID=A0ABU8TD97_9PSEU